MTSPIKRLARDAAQPFEQMGAQLLRRGALLILAVTCFAVSLAFFTIALYGFLLGIVEPEIAAVIVGGVYLCTAILFAVFARTATQKAPDPGGRSRGALPAVASAGEKSPWQSQASKGFSRQVDRIIAPVFNVLREAGLERERAMLVAASSVVKEITPLAAVALAIVAGFALGRRLQRPR
jgi:hypothetical protein